MTGSGATARGEAVLIDYGAGNLHSVEKALGAAGLQVRRAARPEEAEDARLIVLPGQGHFRQAMEAFLASGFEPLIRAHVLAERPFLGICVGLQLLMADSEEAPGLPGLGLLPGRVRRFPRTGPSVPQMGWNRLTPRGAPPLLAGVEPGAFVYFAHSYYVEFGESAPGATSSYGEVVYQSAYAQGPLNATQFHPEKSQAVGLRILGNVRSLVGRG